MFDKNGFIAFVGADSGASYASGLENIERIYGVDIDQEMVEDHCARLLGEIEADKKLATDNDLRNRQNWCSHLKKYIEFCGMDPAELRCRNFVAWFKKQSQRKAPGKVYTDATVRGAVDLLKSGMKHLGVPAYENVNCFAIDDAEEFAVLYHECYEAATVFDKKAGHGDFRNGLDFYLQFLREKENGAADTEMYRKIRMVIAHYKANFATVKKQERFKWEAICWYQRHWDIDDPDFVKMLEKAFGKAGSLLASGMYYPLKMITEYAALDPEEVRRIFRVLYDENIPLEDRYKTFKASCDIGTEAIRKTKADPSKKLNHYQDPRAVMVYLTFRYPEKYYLFKSTMYTNFRDRVGFVEPTTKKTVLQKVENFFRLCDIVLAEALKDDELMAMHAARLDDDCYKDDAFHMLAMDIVFYGSAYMAEELFASGDQYWPALKDYDPGITTQQWVTLLQDESVTDAEVRKLLEMFLELGGESSFTSLVAHFGDTIDHKKVLQEFSDRVIAKVGTAKCSADFAEYAGYIVPFVGRMITEGDTKRNSWKLRNELRQALEELIFWPPLSQYDPELTAEDWKRYIREIELPNHPGVMQMLKALLENNGQASCKQLAAVYGGTVSRYVGCAVNMGRRAKAYFGLPACVDAGQERYFAVPFLGKHSVEGGKECYIYRLRPELHEALKDMDLSAISAYVTEGDEESVEKMTDVSVNTILYGPPGTGKTYHTVIYAVAIIENKKLCDVQTEDYETVLARYNEYKVKGFVEFTTFHQSFGYEEFIEGIKPVISEADGNQIQYCVEAGVFKRFCELASNEGATFDEAWSALVAAAKKNGEKYTFTRRTGSEFLAELKDEDAFVVNWNGEKQSCNALKKEKALEQWERDDYGYRDALTGGTKWEFDAIQAILDTLVQKFVLKKADKATPESQNYVFIIDEINRGNISKIFGELITLIEESKRVGNREGAKALLPYSMKPFGVPKNVYIIGTMNTADRSIAAMDTALRRRFEFKEMMPEPDTLSGIKVGGVVIADMLERMNRRITVLYDREHTIGHAYFMPLKEEPTVEKLAEIFRNKVIPLLQEYFYEDYEKIRLVLADNQKKEKSEEFIQADKIIQSNLFGNADVGLDEAFSYKINGDAFENIEAYRLI